MVEHCNDDDLSIIALGEPASPADEAHLQQCPRCQSRLDQLSAVVSTARPIDDTNRLHLPPQTSAHIIKLFTQFPRCCQILLHLHATMLNLLCQGCCFCRRQALRVESRSYTFQFLAEQLISPHSIVCRASTHLCRADEPLRLLKVSLFFSQLIL